MLTLTASRSLVAVHRGVLPSPTLFPRMLTAALGVSCLLLSACARDWGPPGPERTETRSIELDKSEEVKVDLKMGAGELRVGGGADN